MKPQAQTCSHHPRAAEKLEALGRHVLAAVQATTLAATLVISPMTATPAEAKTRLAADEQKVVDLFNKNTGAVVNVTNLSSRYVSTYRGTHESQVAVPPFGPPNPPFRPTHHLSHSLAFNARPAPRPVHSATGLPPPLSSPMHNANRCGHPRSVVAARTTIPKLAHPLWLRRHACMHACWPGTATHASTCRRDAFTADMQDYPAGAGSGIVWDKQGHVVTNYHVIKGASTVQVSAPSPAVTPPDPATRCCASQADPRALSFPSQRSQQIRYSTSQPLNTPAPSTRRSSYGTVPACMRTLLCCIPSADHCPPAPRTDLSLLTTG